MVLESFLKFYVVYVVQNMWNLIELSISSIFWEWLMFLSRGIYGLSYMVSIEFVIRNIVIEGTSLQINDIRVLDVKDHRTLKCKSTGHLEILMRDINVHVVLFSDADKICQLIINKFIEKHMRFMVINHVTKIIYTQNIR